MASSKKPADARCQPDPPVAAGQKLEDAIRTRAYELYVERGGVDGNAETDWLRAEAEILKQCICERS